MSDGAASRPGGPRFSSPTFAVGELLASRFSIVRFIARGGMGEVYEAIDQELHDRVALKTVRADIAVNDQALKRFRREVLLARKVTHPNICRTFDVFRHSVPPDGDPLLPAGDVVFVSMELLAGETLAERIRRVGRLSAEEALPLVRQMAAGLDAAHAAGVVHRDFKSSNVILLPAAAESDRPPRVVTTDFGLASGSLGPDTTQSDTTGILGTPAYMAPEQIEGAPVTPAVDIYALGIVMFEMVTGVRPFIGDTPFSTALKRLHEPPPSPTDFAPDLNPAWSAAILRCLRRDPAERFRTGSEIVAALTGGPFETVSTRAVRLTAPAKRRHVLLAATAGVVILAGVAWWSRPSSPAGGRLGGGNLVQVVSSQARAYDPVLSPDGRMLAYVAAGTDGQIDLFIGDARGEGRVRLTDDAAREEDPRISPDGTRLAFTRLRPDATSAEIWTVPALGGQPMLLIPNAAFPAWSPDGRQLAFVHRPNPSAPPVLATANADGSDVRTILAADGAYLNVRAPAWSPDQQEIAFIRGRGGVAGELWIVPAAGGSPRRLSNDTTAVFSDDPVFTPGGESIVHSSNRGGATNIWITPRNGGAPARLTTGPGPDQSPSMARDGTLAFGSSRWRNVLLTQPVPGGTSRTLVTHSPFLWAPAFSPDGRELAYSQGETDGSWHLWTVPVDGSAEPRRITATEHGEVYPRFTADGAYILFQNWNEPRRLWRVPRAGGAPELLQIAQNPGDAYADISPDGRRIAFVRVDNEAEHVYVATVGGGPARRLTTVPGSVPKWSPDGRWIVFARDRSYAGGVFVVRADGSGLRRLTERGGWPVWWPDGRQIAYLAVGQDGNQVVEIVSATGGPSRRFESLHYTDTNYPVAISPDGTLIATSNASHVSDEIWLLQSGTD